MAGAGHWGLVESNRDSRVSEKKWHVILTIGAVRTYVSTDRKIEMTVRPTGRGTEIREFAVLGKPRQRFASENAARARLTELSQAKLREIR